MGAWKAWERETQTTEYQYTHGRSNFFFLLVCVLKTFKEEPSHRNGYAVIADPERFRFARDTSFGRRHLSFWSGSPILLWMVCLCLNSLYCILKAIILLYWGNELVHISKISGVFCKTICQISSKG